MHSCLFLVTAITSVTFAIEGLAAAPATREGDMVTLAMSGDVAKQYMIKTTGKNGFSSDLRVSIVAEVVQCYPDGRISVELIQPLKSKGKEDRLLTVSAIVSPKNISTATTPKGTSVYASPADHEAGRKTHVTVQDSTQSTVALADLKDVTIRTWVPEQN